jgi:four helix bundle protein
MTFDAYERSLELLRLLAPLLGRLAAVDDNLASQARRAATSVALNVAEANRRTLRDRTYRFRIALGSAAEVASCLDVAVALGYLAGEEVAPALALVDRVRAMTYRLSR